MKLSEAIREGAQCSLPLSGEYIWVIDGRVSACALGCALLPLYPSTSLVLLNDKQWGDLLVREFPLLHDVKVFQEICRLNDREGLGRETIAACVERWEEGDARPEKLSWLHVSDDL